LSPPQSVARMISLVECYSQLDNDVAHETAPQANLEMRFSRPIEVTGGRNVTMN
jgi:hypothetical protein